MGRSDRVSWSFSSQAVYDLCPRAYYLERFARGDEQEDKALFLSGVTTPEALAGTVVHWAIGMALQNFQSRRKVMKNLEVPALREYDAVVKESGRVCRRLEQGVRPPNRAKVLLDDFYGKRDLGRVREARDAVRTCLDNFERSEVWEHLTRYNPKRKWLPLIGDNDPKPFFHALGGLRAFAAYDLALRLEGEIHILDWKTGWRTPDGDIRVRRQLAGYAAWAFAKGWDLSVIRVQPVWLRESPPKWAPEPVDESLIGEVREKIATMERTLRAKVWHGTEKARYRRLDVYWADSEDFKPKPEVGKCGRCKFMVICKSRKLD